MTDTNESIDVQVSTLFDKAIVKLKIVEQEEKDKQDFLNYEAPKRKKDIVIELAKSLEEKIAMDTICKEIINKLPPLVSERFIRECLDKKI